MHEIPKQLLAWLRQLLPQQKNTGSGAIQVGVVGDVTVVNITHHAVTHMPHIHANAGHRLSPVSAPSTSPKRQANPAQREVLHLMKQLDDRECLILDFMHREFGTRRVIELNDAQLYRVRRYVEVSLQRGAVMSQSKWACAAVLLSVALCAPAWGISKCTAPDGSVTFQDAPCSGKGEQISVKPASGNAAARTPVTSEKPAELQKQISENKQATSPEQYPPTAPTKTQLDIEADMCLAWYKPLLRDPQGAYYTQAKKDNRVVTITIHGLNGYGGYVTKSAACEIHAGALDDGWTRKHAKRGGWGDK